MEPLSQSKSKLFASLLHKKYRYKHRLFIAEGEKCVEEALQSDWRIETIVKTEESDFLLPGDGASIKTYQATPDQLARLTEQAHPEGILAVLSLPDLKHHFHPGPTLLLDGLQDPGNLGAIMRVADWFGVRQVWLGPGTVDPFHPKVIRSSMGSIFRMRMQETGDLVAWISHQKDRIWIADLEGEPLGTVAPGVNDVLVIGNESRGISEALRTHAEVSRIRIPGGGLTESLNAAVAAGIMLWEWQGNNSPE